MIQVPDDPVLVADVGGTHARFALTTTAADSGLCEGSVRRYEVAGHDSLEAVARQYVEDVGADPVRAVLAVAGRIEQGTAVVVNNPWQIRAGDIRQALGLEHVQLVNDFVAQSMCLPLLSAADLEPIGDVPLPRINAERDLSLAVIGPGTGLGVGALRVHAGRYLPLESEGGHVNFAPGNALEIAVLEYMLDRFEHVSSERLISGMGLVNLYQALAAIEGVEARDLTPEQVTTRAGSGEDGLCRRTLQTLSGMFGSVAGDAALMLGAWDGVFLAGGLSPILLPWLKDGDFRMRFEAKGRRSPTLRKLPCAVVTHPQAGLLGAAAIAGQSG